MYDMNVYYQLHGCGGSGTKDYKYKCLLKNFKPQVDNHFTSKLQSLLGSAENFCKELCKFTDGLIKFESTS